MLHADNPLTGDTESCPPVPEGLTRADFLKRTAGAGASLSLMSILAACGGGGSAAAGGSAEQVKWALSGIVPSLDTLSLGDNNNKPVLFSIYDGLMRIDDGGKIQPNLAEKWEQPDALTYVYTLRSGVKFSDGSPLTAEDVAYSFQRQLDPDIASANAYVLGTLKSVEATGDLEVTMKLSAPDVQASYAAASVAGLIVSKAFVEKHGKKTGTPGALPVTSGPYKVDSFVSGKQIIVSRNPHYWGGKAPVARHVLNMFADPQARQVAMRTGTVGAAIQFPLSQSKQWEAIKGVKASYVPFHRTQFLSFDLTQAPWNDAAVRTAMAFGIDREGIVKSALSGHGEVPATISAPVNWEAIAPGKVDQVLSDVPKYTYDPERAKSELAKSSRYGKGLKGSLTTDQSITLTAQALAENLRPIGIDLSVRELPTNDFYGKVLPHKNLGLLLIVFGADYPDPDNFMTSLNASENAKPNYYNTANYKNPTVDKLFVKEKELAGRIATNPEKVNLQRAQILGQAAKILMTDLPYIPIACENASVATRTPVSYKDFNPWYTFQPVFKAAEV